MNKRGNLAGVLIIFSYIVLASMVFILLYSNVQSIATGSTLIKNAMIKDNAFLVDAAYLVDGSLGKEFAISYKVPSSLITPSFGEELDYNEPSTSSLSSSTAADSVVIKYGESKNG